MKKQSFLAFLLTAALLISTAFPASALVQNDTLEQQNGVFVIYFETGGGTGIPVIATTTSSGKLAELPTPTMSGYTFEAGTPMNWRATRSPSTPSLPPTPPSTPAGGPT